MCICIYIYIYDIYIYIYIYIFVHANHRAPSLLRSPELVKTAHEQSRSTPTRWERERENSHRFVYLSLSLYVYIYIYIYISLSLSLSKQAGRENKQMLQMLLPCSPESSAWGNLHANHHAPSLLCILCVLIIRSHEQLLASCLSKFSLLAPPKAKLVSCAACAPRREGSDGNDTGESDDETTAASDCVAPTKTNAGVSAKEYATRYSYTHAYVYSITYATMMVRWPSNNSYYINSII